MAGLRGDETLSRALARKFRLALFRALDRMDLSPAEIPQRLLRQLFELDADCAEALWALDQPPETLDRHAMLGQILAALELLPEVCASFRTKLPPRVHPALSQLESTLRHELDPTQAYSMVPGRDPQSG